MGVSDYVVAGSVRSAGCCSPAARSTRTCRTGEYDEHQGERRPQSVRESCCPRAGRRSPSAITTHPKPCHVGRDPAAGAPSSRSRRNLSEPMFSMLPDRRPATAVPYRFAPARARPRPRSARASDDLRRRPEVGEQGLAEDPLAGPNVPAQPRSTNSAPTDRTRASRTGWRRTSATDPLDRHRRPAPSQQERTQVAGPPRAAATTGHRVPATR